MCNKFLFKNPQSIYTYQTHLIKLPKILLSFRIGWNFENCKSPFFKIKFFDSKLKIHFSIFRHERVLFPRKTSSLLIRVVYQKMADTTTINERWRRLLSRQIVQQFRGWGSLDRRERVARVASETEPRSIKGFRALREFIRFKPFEYTRWPFRGKPRVPLSSLH